MENKKSIIIWGSIIMVGLLVAAGFGVRAVLRSQTLAPFEEQIPNYLAAHPPRFFQPGPPGAPMQPPVPDQASKGKYILIDHGGRTCDYTWFDLPAQLKAPTPAEVKTVVWINWGSVAAVKFPGNRFGYQHFCDVCVIDKDTNTTIGQRRFVGTMPPTTISSRSSSTNGSKPYEDLVNYLQSMAR
jgi:hypothetical protein